MPTADQEWSSRAKLARGRLLENRAFRGPKSGNIVTGAFTPVLARHSISFSLIDCISVGVDRMQRNFDHMLRMGRSFGLEEMDREIAGHIRLIRVSREPC
jgi:hypothetical protein